MTRTTLNLSCLACLSLLVGGCSDRTVSATEGPGDDVGYTDNTDVVVAGAKTWIVSGDPDGCVKLGDQCVDIATVKQQSCGSPDAQADIVVIDGKVVKVVCYPPPASGVSIDKVGITANGSTTVPQNSNNTVITFAPESNGKPIQGDVRLDAESVSLIGNGIDKTIFGGNLTLNSNNFHIRGLTVLGNLTLEKNCNGATVAFVKVKGNLTVAANNVTILSSIVFGNLQVAGQSPALINVGVGGTASLSSPALLCDSNYSFADKNSNGLIEPAEKGAPILCKPSL